MIGEAGNVVGGPKVPAPRFRSTETLPPKSFVTTRSWSPSPSKSPFATQSGPDEPVPYEAAVPKPAASRERRTETEFESWFVTAASGTESPLKSAMTIDFGFVATENTRVGKSSRVRCRSGPERWRLPKPACWLDGDGVAAAPSTSTMSARIDDNLLKSDGFISGLLEEPRTRSRPRNRRPREAA